MNVDKQLEAIVAQVLENYPGVFLVESNHAKTKHEFIIDGDKPLGIYDISEIGRSVNHIADETMPDEKYTLDICSPGADSDLKMLRQYPKHIGREFAVTLKDDTGFNGFLRAVDGQTLSFEYFVNPKPKKNETPVMSNIEFENIKKAHIIISFK